MLSPRTKPYVQLPEYVFDTKPRTRPERYLVFNMKPSSYWNMNLPTDLK